MRYSQVGEGGEWLRSEVPVYIFSNINISLRRQYSYSASVSSPRNVHRLLSPTLGRTFLTDSNIADEFYRGRRKSVRLEGKL